MEYQCPLSFKASIKKAILNSNWRQSYTKSDINVSQNVDHILMIFNIAYVHRI